MSNSQKDQEPEMLNFIFPVLFILFAIFFIVMSKSQRNYEKLVENNGEKFANQVTKYGRVCGYLLLVCSGFWLLLNWFTN